MHIYLIGIPDNGGCWFSSGSLNSFFDYDEALRELKSRQEKQPYLRLFTITPKTAPETSSQTGE